MAENLSINDKLIIDILDGYRTEAEAQTEDRRSKNRDNMDAFFNKQDWSYKEKGQSKESLPLISQGVEIFTSAIKEALNTGDSWFDIDLSSDILTTQEANKLMRLFLGKADYVRKFADSIKLGMLKALIINKNYGQIKTKTKIIVDEFTGERREEKTSVWEFKKDVIDPDDFIYDPQNKGLYRRQVVDIDYHTLVEAAERGVYLLPQVKKLKKTNTLDKDAKRRSDDKNQKPRTDNGFRKNIVLEEWHCDLINRDGELLEKDVLITVANKDTVIRKQKNLEWQNSPYVVSSLIEIPLSTTHKAIVDDAVSLNKSINELVNLLIDEGMLSVYGLRVAFPSLLRDSSQLNNICGPTTFIAEDGIRSTEDPIKQINVGSGLQNGFAVLQFLITQIQTILLFTDFSLGKLPGKDVKATEVIEQKNQFGGIRGGITRHLDNDFLKKDLLNIWQLVIKHIDEADSKEVADAIGVDQYLRLISMSRRERYLLLGRDVNIKVFGLSSVSEKQRIAQRLLTFSQVAIQNPVFQEPFLKEYSGSNILRQLVRSWNIPAQSIEKGQDKQGLNEDERQLLDKFRNFNNGNDFNGNGNRSLQTQDLINSEQDLQFPTGSQIQEAF